MFISTRSFRYKCNLRKFPSFPSFSVFLQFHFSKSWDSLNPFVYEFGQSPSVAISVEPSQPKLEKNISINVQMKNFFVGPRLKQKTSQLEFTWKINETKHGFSFSTLLRLLCCRLRSFDYNWSICIVQSNFMFPLFSLWFNK